jgi:thioredoxin reductase (NADPH)
MNSYDVIIIGAGPIGLSCGIEAVRENLSHLILEKGCLVNSLFHYPINMTFFSTSDRLEIGGIPFVSHGDKPTRRESLEYYRRAKEVWKLNVNVYEEVLSVKGIKGNFKVKTSKDDYIAGNIIIATGFYDQPNMMNIPGENLPKVKHYFDEPHPYAYLDIAVIGGGNSAVDVALETYRRGSKVTMIIREDALKDGVKYWVRPDIENRIKEGSITAHFNSEVKEIREKSILISTPDGNKEIKNDFVFAMTGYHSNFHFLENAGIRFTGKYCVPVINETTFETETKGIFLAGVVCSGYETSKWFIENSRDHAERIFTSIRDNISK